MPLHCSRRRAARSRRPLIHPSPDRRDWRRWLQKAASRPRSISRAAVYLIRWNRANGGHRRARRLDRRSGAEPSDD
ncbi:hypothetical protein M8494_32960 [Serratia ureilytica]